MADPRIAKIAATLNAAAAAASITIKAQLDTIGDDAVAEVAADSSPLDVTVVATEFSGATTRQAFNVPAGAVRFIDCEAP